jgi:signal recognition particle subunit SRP54
MGGMASMLKMIPGMSQLGQMDMDDREIDRMEGIVHSMTTQERRDPELIDASRRRRIARGSGRDAQEVAGLIKTFRRSRDLMKSLSGGAMGGLKSLMTGKLDLFGAMSGGRKVKQRSKRKQQPRKKKHRR